MKSTTLLYPILMALSLAAGAAAQTASGPSVIPNPAPSGREFRLYLRIGMPCMDCSYTFSRESVSVNGSRIDLRYVISLPAANPGPPEPGAIRSMAGSQPTFTMPSLAAGRYEVWASQIPACTLNPQPCEIAQPAPYRAGELEVRSDVQPGLILNPGYGPAEKAFDLQLVSGGYSCATAFDSLSAAVYRDTVTLTFYDWERPMGCAVAFELYGPTFHLPALPAGTYRVKVNRLSQRTLADVGPLQILGGVAVAPASRIVDGGRARWRGREVVFALPAGEPGIWQAELIAPDGRISGRSACLRAAGEEAAVAAERTPAQGLYLLRLTGPAGTQRILEIAR